MGITTIPHLPSLDSTTLWSAIESAAEQASIAVYIAHLDVQPPRILYVNARAAEIIGEPAPDLIGRVPWSILRDEDKLRIQQMVDRPTSSAPPSSMEVVVQRADGTLVPIALASTRMKTSVGTLSFGYFRDISSERETLAALRRSGRQAPARLRASMRSTRADDTHRSPEDSISRNCGIFSRAPPCLLRRTPVSHTSGESSARRPSRCSAPARRSFAARATSGAMRDTRR